MNDAPEILYKYYFAPTRSKIFPQAIELAAMAHNHETMNDDGVICHVVSFTDDQIDLMASFYNLARNLLPPQGQYFKVGILSRLEIQRKLENERYIFTPNGKKPKEYVSEYIEIKKLINEQRYFEAVEKYYEVLGENHYGELHDELIYLKRLGKIHLSGRDLLSFRPESDRSYLIRSNIAEYCSYIDKVINEYRDKGFPLPLDIIRNIAATVSEVYYPITIVFLRDDKIDKQEVSKLDWHYSSLTRNGRLFDKYIDQIKSCNIFEEYKNVQKYINLWTTYSPEYYKTEVSDNGYFLVNIDIYKLNNKRGCKRYPDFTSVTSLNGIVIDTIGANSVEFTGRSHMIEDRMFYEINLLRDAKKGQVIGNEFFIVVGDILREAENQLRENHGFPKIGEGWVSEMNLFKLIESVYPEVQHHVRPSWLLPQHLDIFVQSNKIAFEYQGKQHYEAIDFFGGEDSFEKRKLLDELKASKCKSNDVALIHWKYDEPITINVLNAKLTAMNIRNR